MGTLEDQVNARTEAARIRLEMANLADQREAARARFKAALGLRREDPAPPWPSEAFPAPPTLDEDALWTQMLRTNPELGVMRAMVDRAIAEVGVSRKARVPSVEVGAMADLKADPLMVRPSAAITLPVWRDKIAATIAASEYRQEADRARLSDKEINLAAELAQLSFMIREAGRRIDFIDQTALPGIEHALDSARSGYQVGMAALSSLPAMELMAIDLRLEKAAAERERARTFAELSLLVTGVMPDGAPVLAANRRN